MHRVSLCSYSAYTRVPLCICISESCSKTNESRAGTLKSSDWKLVYAEKDSAHSQRKTLILLSHRSTIKMRNNAMRKLIKKRTPSVLVTTKLEGCLKKWSKESHACMPLSADSVRSSAPSGVNPTRTEPSRISNPRAPHTDRTAASSSVNRILQ
jgi:hypothetical protein